MNWTAEELNQLTMPDAQSQAIIAGTQAVPPNGRAGITRIRSRDVAAQLEELRILIAKMSESPGRMPALG